jgi:hypothetical protein
MMYKMQGTYVNKNLRTKANSDLLEAASASGDKEEDPKFFEPIHGGR